MSAAPAQSDRRRRWTRGDSRSGADPKPFLLRSRRRGQNRLGHLVLDRLHGPQVGEYGFQIGVVEILERRPGHRRQDLAAATLAAACADGVDELLFGPLAEPGRFVRASGSPCS